MEIAPPDLIIFVKLKEFEKFYSYVDEKHGEVSHACLLVCFPDKQELTFTPRSSVASLRRLGFGIDVGTCECPSLYSDEARGFLPLRASLTI